MQREDGVMRMTLRLEDELAERLRMKVGDRGMNAGIVAALEVWLPSYWQGSIRCP